MIGAVGADRKADSHSDFYARIVHGNLLAFDRKAAGLAFNPPFLSQPGRPLRQHITESFPPRD